MTILKPNNGCGEVEVRIRREPQGPYFEEFVTLNRREADGGSSIESFIIAEPGVTFSAEVNLKAGYDFGNCQSVNAYLYAHFQLIAEGKVIISNEMLDGTRGDVKIVLDTTDISIGNRRLEGAALVFRKLDVVEFQHDGVTAVPPNYMIGTFGVGEFTVKVCKVTSHEDVSAEVYETRVKRDAELAWVGRRISGPVNRVTRIADIFDGFPSTIDTIFNSDRGIESDIAFVGGRMNRVPLSRQYPLLDESEPLRFTFVCRSQEFLERDKTAPYPVPLHHYPFDCLDNREKKLCLTVLRELNKEYVYETSLDQQLRKRAQAKRWREGDPLEWRAWSGMSGEERRLAYVKLQDSNKEFASRQ